MKNKLLFVNAQHFNRHPTLINPFNSKNNPRGARYYYSTSQTKKLRFSDIEGPSPEQCDCRVSTLFPALAEEGMEHTVGGNRFTMPRVCEQGLGDPLADGMGCVERGDREKHYNFFLTGVSLHFPKLSAYSWRAARADASHLGMISSYLLWPSTFMTHPQPSPRLV